jgi:hypothetical protein
MLSRLSVFHASSFQNISLRTCMDFVFSGQGSCPALSYPNNIVGLYIKFRCKFQVVLLQGDQSRELNKIDNLGNFFFFQNNCEGSIS